LSQYVITSAAYLSPAQSAWRRAGKTIARLNPGSISAAAIVVGIINTMRQRVRREIDNVGGLGGAGGSIPQLFVLDT